MTQPCGSGASPRWIATRRWRRRWVSWPGPPDLSKGRKLEQGELEALVNLLKGHWPA